MASNQTNRFQSLDSSVEEFIDGQENENTKKKTKHDVALSNEFLVFKGETIQFTIQACGFCKQQKMKSRVFTSVFKIFNFRRTNYFDIFSGCLILF